MDGDYRTLERGATELRVALFSPRPSIFAPINASATLDLRVGRYAFVGTDQTVMHWQGEL